MLLKILFLQPLGPAVVLAVVGLLLALGRRLALASALWANAMAATRPDRAGELTVWLHVLRAPFAFAGVAAAGVVLFWLRTPPRPVLAWNWQPLTVAGSTIEWQLDAWNWFAALIILIVAAVSVLLRERELAGVGETRGRVDLLDADLERTLWLAAAALVFVASGNILTLCTSWVLLDGAVAYRLQSFRAAAPAERAWGALSLVGAPLLLVLALLGEDGIRTSLTGGELTPVQLWVLWFAALVRAGVYPLHFWLTGTADRPVMSSAAASLAVRPAAPAHGSLSAWGSQGWSPVVLLAGVSGLWLVARVQALGGLIWVRRPEWMALGVLALFGTALVAWTVEDGARRWRWIALNRTGVAVVTAYMAAAARPDLLTWPLVTFALGCALLAAGQAAAVRLGLRLPVIGAALILWGAPGAAGFLARSSLVFPTELAVAAPLFAVVVLAEILFVASLWQAAVRDAGPRFAAPAERRGQGAVLLRLALALVIAGAPLIAWGLFPGRLAQLAGFAPAETFGSLRDILALTRRSVWIGLAASAVGGVTLGLLRQRIFGQMRGWQAAIVEIAGLEWLYRLLGAGFMLMAGALRYFATLGEGEGYLGWLAVAAFLLWVLLRA